MTTRTAHAVSTGPLVAGPALVLAASVLPGPRTGMLELRDGDDAGPVRAAFDFALDPPARDGSLAVPLPSDGARFVDGVYAVLDGVEAVSVTYAP